VSAKCEPTFLSPLQVSNARFKQAEELLEALVQLRQAGEQKCALIGAPRVGGTIECGCGGRASAVALNAAASCAVHSAESAKAHEKELHGRNDSDKAVMEVRT